MQRRNLTPAPPIAANQLHGTRRSSGARRELSERVVLQRDGAEFEGWTLNVSRGGVRLVVEEPVELGAEYDLTIGERAPRAARAVWVQDEADGQIVGLQFLDGAGSAPPPPPGPESE